jgi:hypothetical protein
MAVSGISTTADTDESSPLPIHRSGVKKEEKTDSGIDGTEPRCGKVAGNF